MATTLDFTKISVAAFLRKSNKGSAKRCLFGPVNHEENTRLLREQLASQEQESREKWNFDFRTETPVRGGRFNWEKVSDSSADDQENRVPAAYALPRMTASPLKSRICSSPLTFSSKVNRIQKPTCSAEKKRELSFVAIDNKKDSLPKAVDSNNTSKTELVAVASPAAERVSVTTVPVLKKFREETPTVQELSAKCTRVSDQITPESAENSHLEMEASASSASSQESLSSSPSSRCSPSKRKLAQSDITEFFQVKKSRNTMAVNSAKRRLDL